MVIESKSPLRKWWLQRVVKWEGFGHSERHISRAEPHSWRLSPLGEQHLDSQRPCVHLGTLLSPGAKSAPKPRLVGSQLLPPGCPCIRPPWLVGVSCCSCVGWPVSSVQTFSDCSACAALSFLFPECLPLPAVKGFPSFRGVGPEVLACCSVVGT